jgi:ferritin-like metal-binding protein YciE
MVSILTQQNCYKNERNQNMKILKDLFLNEVADMYDAERRIVKALPKLVKAATCEKLKAALLTHLKETEGHVTKLEQVFKSLDQKAKGKTCKTTAALLEEGGDIVAEFKGSPALNAALISAAQKVEHHEIASYGALHEWAELLGNSNAAGLLEEILGEEKAANATLTKLALNGSDKEALGENSCDKDSGKDCSDQQPANLRRGIRPAGMNRKQAGALV